MRAIDRLYRREGSINKVVEIDDDLYEKVNYISKNILEGRTSKIINVALEHFLNKKDYTYYKKSKDMEGVYRSLYIRKPFYDELVKLKETTGISINRLVNASLKNFLEDFKDELK